MVSFRIYNYYLRKYKIQFNHKLGNIIPRYNMVQQLSYLEQYVFIFHR